jgi:predicted DNA-binding protein
MSDKELEMESDRISFRIPDHLERRLRKHSSIQGKPGSAVVREALEAYLSASDKEISAYELATELGLIGCIHNAPEDLSIASRHFEGFGR